MTQDTLSNGRQRDRAAGVPRFRTPPRLAGYTFDRAEIDEVRTSGGLLSLRLETGRACNLRCRYCNGNTGPSADEVPFAVLERAVDELKGLGGRSVVIIGGGEPLLYSRFRDLVSLVRSRGMVPVVITNAVLLTPELSRFLFEAGASVLFKLDSLDGEVQDRLAGVPGTSERIARGMETLFSAGFGSGVSPSGQLRCGASFVLTAENAAGVPGVWDFCRRNGLYPNLELLIPRNRGLRNHGELALSVEDVRRMKLLLLERDRDRYGCDWLPYTPLPGHGCLQHYYSLYLAADLTVRPCADMEIDAHRFGEMSLAEIVASPFFSFMREIDRHLTGRCGACEHHAVCIGCRGNAFSVGIEEGLSVREAAAREDPLCWKEERRHGT